MVLEKFIERLEKVLFRRARRTKAVNDALYSIIKEIGALHSETEAIYFEAVRIHNLLKDKRKKMNSEPILRNAYDSLKSLTEIGKFVNVLAFIDSVLEDFDCALRLLMKTSNEVEILVEKFEKACQIHTGKCEEQVQVILADKTSKVMDELSKEKQRSEMYNYELHYLK
jgi:hypothetical protein